MILRAQRARNSKLSFLPANSLCRRRLKVYEVRVCLESAILCSAGAFTQSASRRARPSSPSLVPSLGKCTQRPNTGLSPRSALPFFREYIWKSSDASQRTTERVPARLRFRLPKTQPGYSPTKPQPILLCGFCPFCGLPARISNRFCPTNKNRCNSFTTKDRAISNRGQNCI
jgi:hypothetical protein